MGQTPRVLVVTYDVVGPRMAGPGIRAWEFARALGTHFPTTLAAPAPVPTSGPGFAIAAISGDFRSIDQLLALIEQADIVVTQILPLHALADRALEGKHLVVDLYCPWILENLAHDRTAAQGDDEWLMRDLKHVEALLARGDFFICASEKQRDYWLGALVLAGRLTEAVYASGADGRTLIDTVPFGLSVEPPAYTKPVLKGVRPGIGREDFVALWGGGLWDWLDPLTLVRATARLRDAGYPIRTVFLGTQRPLTSHASDQPPAMVERTRTLSGDLGLTDAQVFFNDDWVPYAERANYLLEADVGISLHMETLETRFAFRTRLLDYLWAGLIPVMGEGDALSETIANVDAGRIVAGGDDEGLAQTIATLIDAPEKRAELAANGRRLAESLTWGRVARPLIEYCRRPWRGDAVRGAGLVGLTADLTTTHQDLTATLLDLTETLLNAGEATAYAARLEGELAVKNQHIAEQAAYAARLEGELAVKNQHIAEQAAYIAHLECTVRASGVARAIRARLPGRRRD